MNSQDSQRAIEVFETALEHAPPERDAYLDTACRGNPALRAEVESLLKADGQARGFLEPPAQATGRPMPEADPLVGETIGRYNIKRVIAAGGMGTVYEALQEEPHRTVAIKVIRPGVASRSALRRFKHESEILGRLRHPGIAQIYEAGTHGGDHGSPFFAMEFIPGALAITRYAEDQSLSTRQRLELFLNVCDAVHAGHQRGIIHRDLKPANILVDDSGQPKLIDFGVARATDADLTIATQQTDVGELVGTLRYMSPEQCEGDAIELDTRSDVYALGVVLFELLTSELPYEFKTPSPFDVPRIIREQEPRRLSEINRLLRGDLETIVRKALEKDRDRRYQSVTEFAQDIRRYLRHEPIEARRSTGWYVLRKVIRRHRGAAVVVVSFAVLLSAFAVAMFVLYRRSQTQADTAQQVISVLNRTLTQVDPYAGEGGDALRTLLDKTAAQLEQGFVQDPKVRASVQRTLGAAYMNLGCYDKGGENLRAAYEAHRKMFGDQHVETADSRARFAVWLYTSGDYVAAENALREAIPILKRHKDDRRGELARSFGRLSIVLMYQKRPAEGEKAAREFLQVAEETPDDPDGDIATAANLVSIMLQEQGRLVEADPFLRRALERDRARYGDDHARVARDLHNLAILLRKLGKYDKAEESLRESIRIAENSVSKESPDYVFINQDLANILSDKGDRTGARELHLKVLSMADERLDDANPQKADVYATTADFFLNAGEAERALQLAQRAEAISRGALPPEHPNTALRRALTGRCLLALGRFAEAEAPLLEALAVIRGAFGADDPRTQEVVKSLIESYEHTENLDEARKYRSMASQEQQS